MAWSVNKVCRKKGRRMRGKELCVSVARKIHRVEIMKDFIIIWSLSKKKLEVFGGRETSNHSCILGRA